MEPVAAHATMLAVELAYARPERQWLLSLQTPAGTTIRELIANSGLLAQCPELQLEHCRVGVFSQPRQLDDTVQAGERVEIYRLLQTDPKQARRARAAQRPLRRHQGGAG